MNEVALSPAFSLDASARRALEKSARFWFLTAVAGQWMFAAYVAAYYGGAALRGDLAHWNLVLPHGYVEGETFGNAAVAAHLALAFLVLAGGPLQFVAAVRERLPRLHRWVGRVYLVTAMTTALVGLYMLMTRGTIGDLSQHIAICFNALLIVLAGAFAWGTAAARDFTAHRRWVLRLFLAVGGVWFFRVGFMAWVGYLGAPVGFDPGTFTGPFLTFLSFAQTLLPLAVLEAYFGAQDSGRPVVKLAVAALVAGCTFVMGFGIFVAANVIWLPRI
jgi:uncharacterized membrane protein